MSLLWKVLFGLLLTLPAAAYAAGTLVGPPGNLEHRDPVAIPTGSVEPAASAAPSPTRSVRVTESGSSYAASLGTGSAGDDGGREKQAEPGRRGIGNRRTHHPSPQSSSRPEQPEGPAAPPNDDSSDPAADSEDVPEDTSTDTPEDTTTTETPEDTTTETPEDTTTTGTPDE